MDKGKGGKLHLADFTRLLYCYLDTCPFQPADYLCPESGSKVWGDRQNVLS